MDSISDLFFVYIFEHVKKVYAILLVLKQASIGIFNSVVYKMIYEITNQKEVFLLKKNNNQYLINDTF